MREEIRFQQFHVCEFVTSLWHRFQYLETVLPISVNVINLSMFNGEKDMNRLTDRHSDREEVKNTDNFSR